MMDQNGFEKKQPWPKQDTVPLFRRA